jgi:glycine amidinotransferase
MTFPDGSKSRTLDFRSVTLPPEVSEGPVDYWPVPLAPVNIQYPLHSFDEFTTLRAVIVGSAEGANHPEIDVSFENFFRPPTDPELRRKAIGPIPRVVIDEIEEDIAGFVSALLAFGVEVHRPSPCDSTRSIGNPFWTSSQLYSLMPRDSLLVCGDLVVETPSPIRSRYFETFAFRSLLAGYAEYGAHVIAAPKPMLTDDTFSNGISLSEHEILFDAANCVRLGRDVFVDVNRSANCRGVQWLRTTLQRFVGKDFRVHPMSIGDDHADVTVIPLCPGVIMIDPLKVRRDNLPNQFASWDKVVVEEVMPERDYGLPYPLASNDGIGRNVLMLDSKTAIVDEIQLPLIRALEKRKFAVVPLRYRHGRTLGGSWHCITLDTHRDGGAVSYFD